MNNKKKALTSAVLCSVCALIWIIACLVNGDRLAGTTPLILMISAAVSSVCGAIIWFARYFKFDKGE